LLFPATNNIIAEKICNNLNYQRRDSPCLHEGNEIGIALGFGIALAQSPKDIEQSSKRVDKLLYLAKQNGRGRAESEK